MASGEGKRLWMRTPDKRWIPIPTGAGEDPVVRSVNVWDGTKWLAVTDPAPLFPKAATGRINSVQSYQPGVSWPPGIYNPTFTGVASRNPPWTPAHANWTRLFHLAPRVDPNWRIIQFYDLYPARTRSAGFQPLDQIFYPRGGVTFEGQHSEPNGDGTHHTVTDTAATAHSAQRAQLSTLFDVWAELKLAKAGPQPLLGSTDTQIFNTAWAGMIDLQAIRQRLVADFSQRDPFFNRQFTPIQQMSLKRVIIKGALFLTTSANGTFPAMPPPAADLYAVYGAPGIAFPDDTRNAPSSPGPYTIRRPTSVLAPTTGTPIASLRAYDSTTSFQGNPNDPSNLSVGGEGVIPVDVILENPGEDNISFFIHLPDPLVNAVTISQTTHATFLVNQTALHYATAGHDVPATYRSASDNGYPTTY